MTVSLCRYQDLTEQDLKGWHHLLCQAEKNPPFDSPFFHPELTRLCGSVLDDVRVAVLRNGDVLEAVLPLRLNSSGYASAVTGRLTEFQGILGRFDHRYTAGEFAAQAGIRCLHFDHLPADAPGFSDSIWGTEDSLFADLSQGYELYRQTLKGRGSSLAQAERKARKLEREIGPLKFEYHSTSDEAFEALLQWKHAQHQRSHVLTVLQIPWVRNLLDAARMCETDGFCGRLSTLHAGDQLVAVHLGLCSDTAFHVWFPAYNTDLKQYSPGLVLLLKMAETAAANGMQRIDFGRGRERYKYNFSTGSIRIAEGAIDRRLILSRMRKGWYYTKRWMRTSRFRRQLEIPLNATRLIRQRLAFS